MINYKERDLARELYIKHDWSKLELERRFRRRMTDAWIPRWLVDQKEGYQLAKQKREAAALKASHKARLYYERMLSLEEKNRRMRLRRSDAKKVRAIAKKVSEFDLVSVVKNIKRCPANRFLIGG